MVGRLARYLRAAGVDTEYIPGLSDDEIVRRVTVAGRVLVTRDRALAQRLPGSILLASPQLDMQWRAIARAIPELPHDVAFARCTLCNGPLARSLPAEADRSRPDLPWPRIETGLPLFRCSTCGHLYWEGSHTARLRVALQRWTPAESP